jgi:hypothetical protein
MSVKGVFWSQLIGLPTVQGFEREVNRIWQVSDSPHFSECA